MWIAAQVMVWTWDEVVQSRIVCTQQWDNWVGEWVSGGLDVERVGCSKVCLTAHCCGSSLERRASKLPQTTLIKSHSPALLARIPRLCHCGADNNRWQQQHW